MPTKHEQYWKEFYVLNFLQSVKSVKPIEYEVIIIN